MGKPDLGKVSVGDIVWVREGYGRNRSWRKAVVTKTARVWITVMTAGGWPREMRFRLDDQSDGSGYSIGSYFYTVEQYEWLRAEEEAIEYLRSVGIYDTSRLKASLATIANAIRTAMEGVEDMDGPVTH